MKLSEWLKKSDISCQDLATILGVSRAAVYAWIQGDYLPSGRNLLKLSKLSQGTVTIESFPLRACQPTLGKSSPPKQGE